MPINDSFIDNLSKEGHNKEFTPYLMFKYAIKTEITRRYYERRLRKFFDFIEFEMTDKNIEYRCNKFVEKAKDNVNWTLSQIIRFLQYQKERVDNKEITAGTLKNFVKSLKIFCEMSDISLPWKKITRGLPNARQTANDRAPTIEEIRKLLEYPDRRIKPIVYTMISSGIRLGAWDYLKWKHIIPIENEKGEISAAKIIVYAGENDEYYSFITPEAYSSLLDWIKFREEYGEKFTEESWLMRDIWQTTNVNYGAKWGLATCPKKLNSYAIKRILERGLWSQGLRKSLEKGEKRYEYKAAHGFRKFYKTRTEQVMRPLNVEITLGHDIGLSGSYYKPTEKEVLEDYLKAVELLSINNNQKVLEKQIIELKENSKDNEYIIKAKQHEKDEQIQELKKNDKVKEDALAHLSDQLLFLTERIQEIERKQSK
ncbi:MAG TPA: hypothetical protein VLA74_06815 [Nitrososphaeraceae archaeon]|nr:hypothetical protein [Nitrososphaeraceae archaeon]